MSIIAFDNLPALETSLHFTEFHTLLNLFEIFIFFIVPDGLNCENCYSI
jgi:hypothetical protein